MTPLALSRPDEDLDFIPFDFPPTPYVERTPAMPQHEALAECGMCRNMGEVDGKTCPCVYQQERLARAALRVVMPW